MISAIATDERPGFFVADLYAQGELIRQFYNSDWVGAGDGRRFALWDRENNRMHEILVGILLESAMEEANQSPADQDRLRRIRLKAA